MSCEARLKQALRGRCVNILRASRDTWVGVSKIRGHNNTRAKDPQCWKQPWSPFQGALNPQFWKQFGFSTMYLKYFPQNDTHNKDQMCIYIYMILALHPSIVGNSQVCFFASLGYIACQDLSHGKRAEEELPSTALSHLSLCLPLPVAPSKIAQSRSCSYTLGLRVTVIHVLGAPGTGCNLWVSTYGC